MIYSRDTSTISGFYKHLVVGEQRYAVAVELRNHALAPVRNHAGELLYATPGGGRATARQLLAA